MTTSTPTKKLIAYIIFVLLFACNATILYISFGMKNKLDEHNKIILTLPEDFKAQIAKKFQETGDSLKADAMKSLDKTTKDIVKYAAEKTLQDLKNEREATNKQFDDIKKQIADNAETLAEFKNADERKAMAFLEAARTSQNPDIAGILYTSALAHSDNKAAILSEYIDWQAGQIENALQKNKIEEAHDKLIRLANICDTSIASGSVEDMKAIPELKKKIKMVENEISSYREKQIKSQKQLLTDFEKQIEKLKTYADADKCYDKLTELTVAPELGDRRDQLITKIILKQSYLTAPADELIIPAIGKDTPWEKWLKNFVVRLKSNKPVTKKLEDLGTAAEFLKAAKEANAKEIQGLITEIEQVSRGIYLSYWKERVERAMSAENSYKLNDISALLAESNTFNAEDQKDNEVQIIKLNQYITKAALKEFEDGLKNLKALEHSVADDTYVQMVGATQGQYIQMLLRLKALDAKFANQFSAEISAVTQKIENLGKLAKSCKNRLAITDIEKNEKQRKKFIEWANEQINAAEKQYAETEKLWKVCPDDDAREKYANAWEKIMVIHPGDLSNVDPALYMTYNELKNKIENRRPPTPAMREAASKNGFKRIEDF